MGCDQSRAKGAAGGEPERLEPPPRRAEEGEEAEARTALRPPASPSSTAAPNPAPAAALPAEPSATSAGTVESTVVTVFRGVRSAVGFVDVEPDQDMLPDLRELILSELDNVPRLFLFVVDGLPLQHRHEAGCPASSALLQDGTVLVLVGSSEEALAGGLSGPDLEAIRGARNEHGPWLHLHEPQQAAHKSHAPSQLPPPPQQQQRRVVEHQATPANLHEAVAGGSADAVRGLLRAGADPGRPDERGRTPLSLAFATRQEEAAEALLDAGARLPFSRAGAGQRLSQAASAGDAVLVRMLLGAGAPLDWFDGDGRSALHHAAAAGNSQVVQSLLEAGASPRARDRWGTVPLDDAEANGHAGAARLLRAASSSQPPATVVPALRLPGVASPPPQQQQQQKKKRRKRRASEGHGSSKKKGRTSAKKDSDKGHSRRLASDEPWSARRSSRGEGVFERLTRYSTVSRMRKWRAQ